MRILLLLPLLIFCGSSAQNPPAADESPVAVLGFKWFKDRQQAANAVTVTSAPAAAMIAANKNFEKQRRINSPAGERDPNQDTLDGRGAELERIVQESREPEPVAGFAYLVKLQNGSSKTTQMIFWEYKFTESASPTNVTRRQFLCSVKIKPQQDRDLRVFSLSGPSDVISVKSLSKGSGDQFREAVLINRVEYDDGTFWQRQGWSVNDLKLTPKARSETRNMPVCRSL